MTEHPDDPRGTPRRPYVEELLRVLERAPRRTVVRRGGVDTSAAELLSAIARYARALEGLGIGRGDLVAQYAPNRPEALAVRYATHLLGAASVYLSAPPDVDTRARMLVDLAPQLVVVFPDTTHLLPRTTAAVAAVGPVAGIDLRLDERAATEPDIPLASRARPDDLAVLISSGGTTGAPKASVRHMNAWTAAVDGPPRPERRQLVNGNLAYLSQILVDQTLLGGGLVVLADGVVPAEVLAAVEAERVTDLFLVEPQLFEVMDHPDVRSRDLSSLRAVTHIGASAAPVLRRRAQTRFGPVIAHTYGASEMGIVSALRPDEHDLNHPDRFTCAGHVVPGVDVRFRQPDGSLHPTTGAIEVRSPAMARGYRHRPTEQAAHFVAGWYRSGDLGHLDEDGYLHVLGRSEDCEVVDGVLVTPTTVQETLCRLPSVRYAVVVPDLDAGKRIAAVVAWPGGEVDAGDCVEGVRTEHGDTVADSLRLLALPRIPLTEQGKPDHRRLRDLSSASTTRCAPTGRP